MRRPLRDGSLFDRFRRLARSLFLAGVCALILLGIVTYGAVEYTARPEFCGSCHIMEPYIRSWKASSHAKVACIECHYEPGGVETFEGKFKALSQVAKYVTGTQGTKPFAEVGDNSCLRAGCHAVPMLEGSIAFGNVTFEHSAHLLESRRGKRLRCTSCHTHVLEGEHFTVEKRVCFTCHFKPDPKTGVRPPEARCTLCHEPPGEPVVVAGRPFRHRDFVERGVACTECHQDSIQGRAKVRRERCHSCHEEAGHVERIGEPEFLHENHVTLHKVECFECHDDIRHGLLEPRDPDNDPGACGTCHANPHSPVQAFARGEGSAEGRGPEDRMHAVRVGCPACHTGRTSGKAATPVAAGNPHPGFPKAGNVDCVHCHGPSFDGMLGRWTAAVERHRGQLEELLAATDSAVRKAGTAEPGPLAAARKDLALLRGDPSHGAHNIRFTSGLLRRAAAGLDAARTTLSGSPPSRPALSAFPPPSEAGCALACHAGIETEETVPLDGGRFPHRKHLIEARLECTRCHDARDHGKPAFPRTECASCHHREETAAEKTCSDCHPLQAAMNEGALEDFPGEPGLMAGLDCSDCHGEAPDVVRPDAESCLMCHEEGYDEQFSEWRQATRDALQAVGAALDAAATRGAGTEAVKRARAARDAVLRDGSLGIHNPVYAENLLQEALDGLAGG